MRYTIAAVALLGLCAQAHAATATRGAFGQLADGTKVEAVTLTNSGSLDLHVSSITPSGDYQMSNDICSGHTVSAGSTCTFKLAFLPTALGSDPGSVTVVSDAQPIQRSPGLGPCRQTEFAIKISA